MGILEAIPTTRSLTVGCDSQRLSSDRVSLRPSEVASRARERERPVPGIRRGLQVGVAIIALVLALAGCGGSNSATTAPGSESATTAPGSEPQKVTDVIAGFYAAEANGDAKRACDYMSQGWQSELIQLINKQPSNASRPPFRSCAAAMGSVLQTPEARLLARNVQVNGVKVSGNSAKAKATRISTDGRTTSTTEYTLTKTGGQWRIAPGSGSTTISPTSSP
jgi:hypothetical protein